jgi:hypothetical protein
LRDAARDADRVGLFLGGLGLTATPEKPLALPVHFLLGLGAALRLLAWEARGFFFHREAGLPEARQAVHAACLSLSDPNPDPTELCLHVMRLSVEKFAWNAPEELGADVSLGEAEEEMVLEALADFLWTHRPR